MVDSVGQQGEEMASKVEIIDEKDAPPPPKAMSKSAKENLGIISQLKSGKVARVTPDKDQTLRGLQSGLTRVGTGAGKKVVTWDDGTFVYVKLV